MSAVVPVKPRSIPTPSADRAARRNRGFALAAEAGIDAYGTRTLPVRIGGAR